MQWCGPCRPICDDGSPTSGASPIHAEDLRLRFPPSQGLTDPHSRIQTHTDSYKTTRQYGDAGGAAEVRAYVRVLVGVPCLRPCPCIHVHFIHTNTASRSFLEGVEMDEERYLGLLAKLIGEAEHLQNNPAQVRARVFSDWLVCCCFYVYVCMCVCGGCG